MTIDHNPVKENWGCATPVRVCGGRGIVDKTLEYDTYGIGKKKLPDGTWEGDAAYRASERYFTIDHVPIPKNLYQFTTPPKPKSESSTQN